MVTIPIRRARYPSSQSVTEAIANRRQAKKPADREGEKRMTTNGGIRNMRRSVRILGRCGRILILLMNIGNT
jgi:hypothetical protein